MKKCPSCNKTYEDTMRFCQVDGTPLVDDEPAFDPYATIMAKPEDIKAAMPAEEPHAETPHMETPEPDAGASEVVLEPAAEPIAEPDDVLDLPERSDPLKTMYVSEAEMQSVMGTDEPAAPAEPEPPSFSAPEVPEPSFGPASTPPPSPFSEPQPPAEDAGEQHRSFGEAPTMIQPPASPSFEEPAPAPAPEWNPPPASPPAEWTPPPAPDAAWQNQEIGSNTPFQPPVAGSTPSKGLALGSLICGILSCTICASMGLFLGPVAIVLGFMGKKRADEDPSAYGGRGLALGGMITGAVGFVFGLLVLLYFVVVFGYALS